MLGGEPLFAHKSELQTQLERLNSYSEANEDSRGFGGVDRVKLVLDREVEADIDPIEELLRSMANDDNGDTSALLGMPSSSSQHPSNNKNNNMMLNLGRPLSLDNKSNQKNSS